MELNLWLLEQLRNSVNKPFRYFGVFHVSGIHAPILGTNRRETCCWVSLRESENLSWYKLDGYLEMFYKGKRLSLEVRNMDWRLAPAVKKHWCSQMCLKNSRMCERLMAILDRRLNAKSILVTKGSLNFVKRIKRMIHVHFIYRFEAKIIAEWLLTTLR